MRILTYILAFLVLLLGISFACLNADSVGINYYLGTTTMPLSILLVLTLGVGLFLGFLSGLVMYIKLKKENYSLRGRMKIAEKEVENLRAIPLKD